MKFAFALFRYYPFGGLQGDTLRIAAEALRRGHEVTLYTTEWRGAEPPPGLQLRIIPRRGWCNHVRIRNYAADFAAATAAADYDLKVAFDRIPGCGLYFAADNCRAAKLLERFAPWFLRCHPRYRQILMLERAVLTDPATHIACIAERQIADYQRIYQVPDERLSLLPPGIHPAFQPVADRRIPAAEIRRQCGWSDDAIVLIQIGLGVRKGTATLLKALQTVKQQGTPRPVHALLVGSDHRNRMAALAAKLGLTAETCFTGPRNDVPQLLAATDLMVHASQDEAAGNVLVESIACGTPVIASAVCGFAPIVKRCGGEILPDCDDWQTLAAMIRAFADAPERFRQRLAEQADCRDFYRRPEVFCDRMEHLAVSRQSGS